MLLCLRVTSVPHQSHSFVYFDDGAVEWWGSTDIEVEDAGTGLVADEEEVFEAFGD